MEINIMCDNPMSVKEKIFQDSENKVLKTWVIRNGKEHGKILTHTAGQYEDKALLVLTPDEKNHILNGRIIKWADTDELEYAIKAIYIGRFAQAVLTHYERDFKGIQIIK